jgi:hypothetical protein
MLNLKIKIPFLSKEIYLKNLYLVIICNLTHVQDGNTKVKLMLRILENFYVGSKTGDGSGYGSEIN